MKMRYIAAAVFVLLLLAPIACLPAGRALAQGNTGTTLINPLGAGTDLPTLISKIMDFVVNIGAIVVVFMLVYVGYLFVVAQGSDTKLVEARRALLWTIVGALILLGAKAISAGIQATVQALSTGN